MATRAHPRHRHVRSPRRPSARRPRTRWSRRSALAAAALALALIASGVPAHASHLLLSTGVLAAGSADVPRCSSGAISFKVDQPTTALVVTVANIPAACTGWHLQIVVRNSTGALLWRTRDLTVPPTESGGTSTLSLSTADTAAGDFTTLLEAVTFDYVLRQG